MNVRILEDRSFIYIDNINEHEYKKLQMAFTKRVENYHIIKKKMPNFDGEISFLDGMRIPYGLWCELFSFCKESNIPLNVYRKELLIESEITLDFVEDWARRTFVEEMFPYYYQLEAVEKLVKTRKSVIEVSTSGGKTYISYITHRLITDELKRSKQTMIVVPSTKLLSQAHGDFREYSEKHGHSDLKYELVCEEYNTGDVPGEDVDIIIGTYQSLSQKPLEYFQNVGLLICDEAHHAKSKSYRTIISRCRNSMYKFGMTGTLPAQGTCEIFTIQAYLGPRVYHIKSKQLIDEGFATPIVVQQHIMRYTDPETLKALFLNRLNKGIEGSKSLELELTYMRNNTKRFEFVCSKIKENLKRNSLVIYMDIKNGYGQRIYNRLRESLTDKTVFYVDGSVKNSNREYYIQQMENREDIVIVASMGTFSEGVSIKNLHEVYVTECGKSDQIVGQLLGRGMRLYKKGVKTHVIMHDFVDDMEYKGKVSRIESYRVKNYLKKHGEERRNIYEKRSFPYTVHEYDF